MNIFLDTSFLYAQFVQTDPHHEIAKSLTAEIPIESPLYINNLVLYETITLLAFKQSRRAALHFGIAMFNRVDNGQLTCLNIDEARERHSWQIFQSTEKKDVSFVDASILSSIAERQLTALLTFDRHFKPFTKKYGFQINGFSSE